MNSASFSPAATSYSLIDDNMFEKNFDICSETPLIVHFCMYSITQPFYVEGISAIDNETNIYGRVLPKYNIPYPCLKWVAVRDPNTHQLHLPTMEYECYALPNTEDEFGEFSQETLRFENEIHQYFLSMFKPDPDETKTGDKEPNKENEDKIEQPDEYDIYHIFANNLSIAYKGFDYDDRTKNVYVFYDFSPVNTKLILKDGRTLVMADELKASIPIFNKHSFLTRVEDYQPPSLLYMCVYDASSRTYKTVDVHMSEDTYLLPFEHNVLGCTAYYFTEKPIDPTMDITRCVRFACIESRIMYEVEIRDNEIYYMGDNMTNYMDLFEMGVVMCSTLHFMENGQKMIAIKNSSHIHKI